MFMILASPLLGFVFDIHSFSLHVWLAKFSFMSETICLELDNGSLAEVACSESVSASCHFVKQNDDRVFSNESRECTLVPFHSFIIVLILEDFTLIVNLSLSSMYY
jgi:hypothetical protein